MPSNPMFPPTLSCRYLHPDRLNIDFKCLNNPRREENRRASCEWMRMRKDVDYGDDNIMYTCEENMTTLINEITYLVSCLWISLSEEETHQFHTNFFSRNPERRPAFHHHQHNHRHLFLVLFLVVFLFLMIFHWIQDKWRTTLLP